MGTNGSFFQNGLPVSSANSGVGNIPAGAPVPNKANNSFYLSGSVYATLMNSDALLAAINAQQALATAAATAAQGSATSAATSAAAAAATLAGALVKANNLSDLTSVSTALTNLGLQNVNNTSDANKPVSTAQATADALVASNAAAATALKANIASPALTGVPTAPTAAPLANSTQIATTAYDDAANAALQTTLNAAIALKAPLASPALTGVPTAPTAAVDTNTTQVATTAMVLAQASAAAPLMDGTATIGTSTRFARADHIHASDTSRAPLASPALTGTPTAPTAAALTNSTQIATTAYADTADALKAPLASPTFTGTPAAPTPTAGDNSTKIATTAFLATALANLPIDGTAWTPWTPTVAVSGGSGTATGRYKKFGKTVYFTVNITCTASGTFTTCTTPTTVQGTSQQYFLVGREGARTGVIWWGYCSGSSNAFAAGNYINSSAMTTGDFIVLSGSYEAL